MQTESNDVRPWRMREVEREDVRRKPGAIVSDGIWSFDLSHKDAQDMDQWRMKIRGNWLTHVV